MRLRREMQSSKNDTIQCCVPKLSTPWIPSTYIHAYKSVRKFMNGRYTKAVYIALKSRANGYGGLHIAGRRSRSNFKLPCRADAARLASVNCYGWQCEWIIF